MLKNVFLTFAPPEEGLGRNFAKLLLSEDLGLKTNQGTKIRDSVSHRIVRTLLSQ